MIKILNFGDTHIHSFHEFSKPVQDGLTTRLKEHIGCYEWICSLIRRYQPDLVVNNGDIIHTQSQVSSEVLQVAATAEAHMASVCKSAGAEYVVLVGNHDKKSNDASVIKTTHFLKYINGINLIDEPSVRGNIAYIPHCTREQLSQYLNNLSKAKFGFAHLDISGCRFSANMVDTHGINNDMFSNFKFLINGHYHGRQEFNTNNGKSKVYCTGAPQYWSFREPRFSTGRGVSLIEYNDSNGSYIVNHIDNNVSPDFVTLQNLEDIKNTKSNDYLKLQVLYESDLDDYKHFLEGRQYSVEILVDRKNINVPNFDLEVDKTTVSEDIEMYIDKVKGGLKLDKDTLIKVGIDLTSKV